MAQRARNSSIYSVCGVLCRLVSRAERAEGNAPMHMSDPAAEAGCLRVFIELLNGHACGLLLRWLKQGWRSGRKSARFVLKMGLEILLGVSVSTMTH